jgi:hypothetical protein
VNATSGTASTVLLFGDSPAIRISTVRQQALPYFQIIYLY